MLVQRTSRVRSLVPFNFESRNWLTVTRQSLKPTTDYLLNALVGRTQEVTPKISSKDIVVEPKLPQSKGAQAVGLKPEMASCTGHSSGSTPASSFVG